MVGAENMFVEQKGVGMPASSPQDWAGWEIHTFPFYHLHVSYDLLHEVSLLVV